MPFPARFVIITAQGMSGENPKAALPAAAPGKICAYNRKKGIFFARMSTFVISVLTALIVSSFCSLMEAVLLSLTPIQIAEITEKSSRIGSIWSVLKQKIDRPISAILILNTSAHTIGATVAGNALASLSSTSGHQKTILWTFSFLFTFVMLQYTEILPKTLGVHYNKTLAPWLAHPLLWMIRLTAPIAAVVHWLDRPFAPKGHKVEYASGIDELRYTATMARKNRQIGTLQEEIIVAAARLSRQKACDVMIPFEDIVLLSSDLTPDEAIEIAHVDAHTRFPVYEGTVKEKIVGYVNFKEIISFQKLEPETKSFKGIVRPVQFADIDAPATDLLFLFTRKREHLAMVRDKKGNCVGMVTLEDIIEELVGELDDEFDRLPTQVHPLQNRRLLVGGGYIMRDVRREITRKILRAPLDKGYDFASEKDDLQTLDAWLEDRLGREPGRGDQIVINGIEFKVRRMRRGHVFDVQIKKTEDFEE